MQHRFSANHKMSELIDQNHSLLLVISRFGLHLGFGNLTVCEICKLNNIDCATFLAVVNFISEDNFEIDNDYEDINIDTVVDYLENAHKYFLEFKLPSLRNKLFEAVNQDDQNIPYGIVFMNFFDEYVKEVKSHMEYENKKVFKYAKQLAKGKTVTNYSISVFRERHTDIDSKLEELKKILIKYYPDNGNSHLLTEVLFDILSCEIDIVSHNKVENYLFIPAVEAIERKIKAVK